MKKIILSFLLAFICCNLFAFERFDTLYGIKRGMNKTEVKKLAEAEDWLLKSETDTELYYMPSFKRIMEGFYGCMTPQVVIFFQNGVSGFIIATDAKDKATVDQIIDKLDQQFGLEYYGIYKNHFSAWKMNQGGNILMSWESSRNMITNEVSEYAQFTINLN